MPDFHNRSNVTHDMVKRLAGVASVISWLSIELNVFNDFRHAPSHHFIFGLPSDSITTETQRHRDF